MRRPASFAGFASDSHAGSWQYAHETPRELAMTAMVGMSWEEGTPRRTLMFFLVSSSGLSGVGCAQASGQIAATMATIVFLTTALPVVQTHSGTSFRLRARGSRR